MNRAKDIGKSPEENYEIFKEGLCTSRLFHKVMVDANGYLDPKKMP